MTKNPSPATTTPTTAALPATVDPAPAGTIVADVAAALELLDGAPVEVCAAVELAAPETEAEVVAAALLLVSAALDSFVELAGGPEVEDSGLAVDEGAALELLPSPPPPGPLEPPQLSAPMPVSPCMGEMQPPCTVGSCSELEVSAAAVR